LKRDALTYLNYWNKKSTRKPLIIRGARQVGKSTLVRLFAEEAGLRLIEINLEKHIHLHRTFENIDVKKVLAAIEAEVKEQLDPGGVLLFLDEIQACPKAISVLRYFYEELPQYRVIAAGSLLEFALTDKNISMPVGRVAFYHLSPLSFEEFLMATQEDYLLKKWREFSFDQEWPDTLHSHFMEALRKYFMIGGMPEVIKAFVDGAGHKEIRELQQNLLTTYVNDFAKYATKSELAQLQILFQRLPQFIGKKIKFSELLPGERANTCRKLLYLLEKAGLLNMAYHSDCDGLPIEAQADHQVMKAYWLDIGLSNQMLGLAWDELQLNERLVNEGVLAEQFVAQELVANFDPVQKPKLHYWLRDGKKGNAEVDFVIQASNNIVPIEVKSGKVGKIKSLLLMIAQKKLKMAIHASNHPPSKKNFHFETMLDAKKVSANCILYQCPLYLVAFAYRKDKAL
jgi:uncharacterized protein